MAHLVLIRTHSFIKADALRLEPLESLDFTMEKILWPRCSEKSAHVVATAAAAFGTPGQSGLGIT